MVGCCTRRVEDIPLPDDLDSGDISDFGDQARAYKDRGLQRGTIWKLLIDNERWRTIILAHQWSPSFITNKMKKEVYSKSAFDVIQNDASLLVQAGHLMMSRGEGFFK